MSRSRNGCGWECCPSGFIEHIKNYRYSRWAYGATFWSYWKWEFECWIGMHNAPDFDDEDDGSAKTKPAVRTPNPEETKT